MFLYTEESGESAKRIILDYVKIKMIKHLLLSANIHTRWHCKISSPILICGIILKCWIKLGASTYTYMVLGYPKDSNAAAHSVDTGIS